MAADRVVERVAAAATELDVDALADLAGELLVQTLPIDRCETLAAPSEAPEHGVVEVPIASHGEVLGALQVSTEGVLPLRLTSAQRAQVRGVADVLALALQAQHAATAVRVERDRIAQDLHDSVGQVLCGLGMLIADRLEMLGGADPWLTEVHGLVARANRELREAVEGLLAGVPAGGLASAVEGLCREAERRAGGSLRVHFNVWGTAAPLGAAGEDALFRVAREALLNVERHAKASSIVVELAFGDDAVSLSVRDDGAGFGADPMSAQGHFGIRTMRRRVEDAGGALHIRPVTPHGVLVEAVIQGRKVTAHAAGTGGGHR